MTTASEVLRSLEWSGQIQGPGTDSRMGYQDIGPMLPACPSCKNAKPTEEASLSFCREYVGHRPGCALANQLGVPTRSLPEDRLRDEFRPLTDRSAAQHLCRLLYYRLNICISPEDIRLSIPDSRGLDQPVAEVDGRIFMVSRDGPRFSDHLLERGRYHDQPAWIGVGEGRTP